MVTEHGAARPPSPYPDPLPDPLPGPAPLPGPEPDLPDEVPPEGLDLDAFYFGERRYLFAVMGAAVALNIATAVPRDQFWMLQDPGFLWGFYVPLNALLFVAMGAMWWSARPWVHWLGLTAMFAAAAIGFSTWKVRGEPAVTPAAVAAAPPTAR